MKKTKFSGQSYEPGDGGISYAMYLIAITMCVMLYMFFKFNSGMYVAEELLENGLHIAENKVMTANQSYSDASGPRVDEFDKEIKRLHIVTSYDESSGLTTNEQAQLRAIGNEFTSTLQSQLELKETKPTTGVLLELCSKDSDITISEPVVIYEPIYERHVTANSDGTIAGTPLLKFKFVSDYEIKNWIKYSLHFNAKNEYVSATKDLISVANTPLLKNGNKVEGATIEATLAISFSGLNNVFANVGSKELFTNNPQEKQYKVKVTQSTDIVASTKDSRQR